MENIKGWVIDLKAVYGKLWAQRKEFNLWEDLRESPDEDTAVLIYGIAEIGVSKEAGRIAVFRCKENPQLVCNLPQFPCWYLHDSAVQFGKDGLVFVHLHKPRPEMPDIELMVLDTKANRYATITQLPKKFYSVQHIDGGKYGFSEMSEAPMGEISMDLKDLTWIEPENKYSSRSVFSRLAVFIAWALPLIITTACVYAVFLFSRLPVEGTVDLIFPDGPLSHETNLDQLLRPLFYAGLLFFLYGMWLWLLSRKKILASGQAFFLLCWMFFLLLISPLVYMGLNAVLDSSAASVHRVDVMDRYESIDPNTSANPAWRLTLASWRPGRSIEILPVTKQVFDQAQPGQSQVILQIKPGYFGYPWIVSYKVTSDKITGSK